MVTPLPPDDALVTRLRCRDEAAFALVLDAWSGGLLRLARSFVSTADSAHEVVQETWLAVVANLDRFEGRSALKTWVYRICVNTAKRRAARESRSVPMSSVDPALFRPAGDPFPGSPCRSRCSPRWRSSVSGNRCCTRRLNAYRCARRWR